MNKIKGSLPNALTFVNMSLGISAILLAVNKSGKIDYLIYASLLIMLAALTDRFDGKVARMLDATSDLGKELDSLSDLISFGVAPVIVAWNITLSNFGVWGYLLALIFPLAGAFRLARYNVTKFDNVFSGMPITVAGGLLAIVNLFNCFMLQKGRYSISHSVVFSVLVVLLSYLMVSKIKIKKR